MASVFIGQGDVQSEAIGVFMAWALSVILLFASIAAVVDGNGSDGHGRLVRRAFVAEGLPAQVLVFAHGTWDTSVVLGIQHVALRADGHVAGRNGFGSSALGGHLGFTRDGTQLARLVHALLTVGAHGA